MYLLYALRFRSLRLACDRRLFSLAFSKLAAYQRRERILAFSLQRDTHSEGVSPPLIRHTEKRP